jgi:hypothetical protein
MRWRIGVRSNPSMTGIDKGERHGIAPRPGSASGFPLSVSLAVFGAADMRILVIHQLPYRKADYHRAVDHHRHEVTYIGHGDRLADLPPETELPARRIEIPADEDFAAGVIARTSRADGYEQVLSLSEFGVLTVCRVRAHLGIEGPTVEQAERAHDKVRMKETLAGSGIRHPRFLRSPSSDTLPAWSGKSVLKPRQGTCSEGVRVYGTVTEALSAFRALDDPSGFELEEYIEGDILHADALVSDGKLLHCVTSKYVNKPVDFAHGMPLGSYQLPPAERHHAFAARVVEALGIASGCVHLEFFETPQSELVFLEIANRMGGAGVVGAHLRHTGIHLPSYEIALSLGLAPPEPEPTTGRFHGWLVFPGHHLAAHHVPTATVPRHLYDHPAVDRIHTLAPGSRLPEHITYQEWLVPVAVEASHQDSAALGAFLQECAHSISFRTDRTEGGRAA